MPYKYGVGIRGLWKQGWSEIPHVMASMPYAIGGLGLSGYLIYDWECNDAPKKRYRYKYTVFRPDDPRWKNVRLD